MKKDLKFLAVAIAIGAIGIAGTVDMANHSNTGQSLTKCESVVTHWGYAPEVCQAPRSQQELIVKGFKLCVGSIYEDECRDDVVMVIMNRQGLNLDGSQLGPATLYTK
jgi:hypothetical protein